MHKPSHKRHHGSHEPLQARPASAHSNTARGLPASPPFPALGGCPLLYWFVPRSAGRRHEGDRTPRSPHPAVPSFLHLLPPPFSLSLPQPAESPACKSFWRRCQGLLENTFGSLKRKRKIYRQSADEVNGAVCGEWCCMLGAVVCWGRHAVCSRVGAWARSAGLTNLCVCVESCRHSAGASALWCYK